MAWVDVERACRSVVRRVGEQLRGAHLWSDIGVDSDLPPTAAAVLARLQREAGTRTGCWDIFAWRGDQVVFVELKQHRSGDRLRPGQERWLAAGVRSGVGVDSFAVVEWTAR